MRLRGRGYFFFGHLRGVIVRVVRPVVFSKRKAAQQQLTHNGNHAGLAAGLAGAQLGVKGHLLRIVAQDAHGRQVEGLAQVHVAPARNARILGRDAPLALQNVQARVGGQLALVFNEHEAVGFGHHEDGRGQADAQHTDQVDQFAGQLGLGFEQVRQVWSMALSCCLSSF